MTSEEFQSYILHLLISQRTNGVDEQTTQLMMITNSQKDSVMAHCVELGQVDYYTKIVDNYKQRYSHCKPHVPDLSNYIKAVESYNRRDLQECRVYFDKCSDVCKCIFIGRGRNISRNP